jgi:hypothetical protein
MNRVPLRPLAAALCLAVTAGTAFASSHREAPLITTAPKVEGTDFYMFNSYEPGRAGFVTLLANYQPLQDAYGGPNYFMMDPAALYEIHIDNNGDAKEDLTFQFRFRNDAQNITLDIGTEKVSIPIIQAGLVETAGAGTLNVRESYSVTMVRGERRSGTSWPLSNAADNSTSFLKPVDNIGNKTLPDYAGYAAQHLYTVNIPGCGTPARLFVGQRKEAFAVNLGRIFDLVNAPVALITDPTKFGVLPNTIDDKNVTTLALEVHKNCLTAGSETVIGGWATASLRQGQNNWSQMSRLGMPLVNEVVIGLKDKDKFNGSQPRNDGQFATYVTHPTLPKLLEIALGLPGISPTNFPRLDLVTTFLTGIGGLNRPAAAVPSEMLRLNTAIPAVPFAQQNRLGVVGNILAGGTDFAGFPNGRRPKDDVVDIALVAVMGGLCVANGDSNALGFGAACKPSAVPLGAVAFNLHDAVDQAVVPLLPGFPYLSTPIPGAP